MLGPLLDESILGAPARFQGRIFAAYPQLQPEVGAVDEFDYFLSSHNLASDHRLVQISAYCAAKILVEALARAGKNVTREKLILTAGADARLQDRPAAWNHVWREPPRGII